MTDLDNIPPSVRLGEVVPPEDPEDWRRPLTWVVAAGMLIAPVVGAAWFAVAGPTDPSTALTGTSILAAILASGAAITGATQRGGGRAALTTIGAGLFGALGVILAGNLLAGGASLGVATAAAVGGGFASVPAAGVAALLGEAPRLRRFISPALIGGVVALMGVQNLFGA
jgi:predicted membrane-bound dolichyl-phosphate-mannose-protein mannosyltransferase